MPYDRLLRYELFRSVRFLDLPSDTHRLVYVALIPEADDFGNLEGGPRRLWRWMHSVSQVKDEAHTVKLLSDLQDADLVRRYEVDGREFWHLPRFKNQRTYWTRICPPSPWCDPLAYTGSFKRVTKQTDKQGGIEKSDSDLNQTSFRPDSDLKIGVGVGVGVEVGFEVGLEKVSSPGKRSYVALARDVLAFLNEKTGKTFQPGKANNDQIAARLKDGATQAQCRQVIAKKVRDWYADEKMNQYLRPATLFNRTKFAQYLGELNVTDPQLPVV